jgi:tetratricopeptide (TPR) repeat protein
MGFANAQAILQLGAMADYDAFISYSHAKDKPVAAALQGAVQRLGKPWYRRRALRIFRDDTSLSATPHLWPSIEEALARSRYLILLVSPQSAASPWVGKEIAYWLAHKSIDTLLLALTEGELNWDGAADDFTASPALPPALKGRFTAEPKWVDVRDYRAGAPARNGKFLDLAADLAATVHGIPKEDLLSQEVRQQRRALTLAWSAAASLLVLAGAAGWQWHTAQTQRAKAESALNAAAATADHLVYDLAIELRNQPGMPVDLVLNILGRAETMQRQLAQANATTPTLQHLEATSLEELSHTLIFQGAIAGARGMAEHAVAIEEDLLKGDPGNPKYQRELAVSLNELGDAHYAAGNYAPAEALFTRALTTAQKLADAAPNDDSLQDDLAISVGRIFAVQIVTGREAAALDSSTREIAILEKLAVKQPDNQSWQYDLSRAYNRHGLLLSKLGRSTGALKVYQSGLAIRQKLVAAAPDNTEYRRGLFDNYNRLGDLLVKIGAQQDALAAYRGALPDMQKLAASDPSNNQWQENLASGYDKIGDTLASGATDEALDNYRNALAIRERLAAADAASLLWPKEIEVSQNKIADILLRTGARDDAVAHYQKAMDIAEKLVAQKPDDADLQSDVAYCYVKMGDIRAPNDRAAARDFYQKGLAIRAKLLAADGADVQYRRDVALTHERLAGLAAADGARDDARASLREAFALREQNAATDPDNAAWQSELAMSLFRLAQAGDEPQPRLERALALLQKLDAAGKLNAEQKPMIANIQQVLAPPAPSLQPAQQK